MVFILNKTTHIFSKSTVFSVSISALRNVVNILKFNFSCRHLVKISQYMIHKRRFIFYDPLQTAIQDFTVLCAMTFAVSTVPTPCHVTTSMAAVRPDVRTDFRGQSAPKVSTYSHNGI